MPSRSYGVVDLYQLYDIKAQLNISARNNSPLDVESKQCPIVRTRSPKSVDGAILKAAELASHLRG